jgi:hypothetical protein
MIELINVRIRPRRGIDLLISVDFKWFYQNMNSKIMCIEYTKTVNIYPYWPMFSARPCSPRVK